LKGIFFQLLHLKINFVKSKCSLGFRIKAIEELILLTSQTDLVTRCCAETCIQDAQRKFQYDST